MSAVRAIWLGILLPGVAWLESSPAFQYQIERHEKQQETLDAYRIDFANLVSPIFVSIRDFIHGNKDEITALSTAIIAVFTTILGVFTISLARSTRLAAEAADLSARAAIAIELPIIRVEPFGFGHGTSQREDHSPVHCWYVGDLVFSNLGRTKAFPIEIQCGGFVGTKLPDKPIYTFSKSFPIGMIFEAEGLKDAELRLNECAFETTPNLYEEMRSKTVVVWFFCSVIYLDFMQNRHEAGFCWQRSETIARGRFRADATLAYNRKT